jgi:hypothetical protein
MLDDKSLLELCLHVSGGFESGSGPSYTSVTGNFDGMGLSCGILQWNAGQNTLQALVTTIAGTMGWDKAQSFFGSSIQTFASLRGQAAVQWCLDHYIANGSTNVDPGAKVRWQNFLSQPESIAAQVKMASDGILAHAKRDVAVYCPDYVNNNRPYVFFFDLIVQQGGMSAGGHTIPPVPAKLTPDVKDAIAFAQDHNPACGNLWATICQGDSEAALLLHYAYARAMLANPKYQWDACSRRGTIACRQGFVHGAKIDFTPILD